MTSWFQSFTGTAFDSMATAFGMQSVRIRHGTATEITPTPIVEYLGPEQTAEPDPLDNAEYLESWQATIPIDTLLAVFGDQATYEAAVAHGELWYCTYPNQTDWIPVRTEGDPKRSRSSGRIEIKLVGRGIDEPLI